jgi:DNA-binding Lrp family transcriptional regulator
LAKWSDKADEVQSLIDKGYTNKELAKHFNVSEKTVKNRLPELERGGYIKRPENRSQVQLEAKGKHTLERNVDGSYTSVRDKLWLRNDRIYDDEYILTQHGFNPADWEIVTVRHNQWENYSKKDGITELFASKVVVKPVVKGMTFDDLVQAVKAEVKPVYFNIDSEPRDGWMLEVPLFDVHFGNSNLAYYEPTQANVWNRINKHSWKQILFVIGQDLFHHDNFRSTTASGTIISNADMRQAVQDAKTFYYPLIDHAVAQTNGNVKIIYSKGNHDESMSYMFAEVLQARYPQLEFDMDVKERKAHVFGNNFIGFTHGDKTPRKEITRLFPVEFPMEWAATKWREVHAGDLHREDIMGKDEWGIMFRTLSTKNKTDMYHDDHGWTTAHKRFMVFQYSEEWPEGIKYV